MSESLLTVEEARARILAGISIGRQRRDRA